RSATAGRQAGERSSSGGANAVQVGGSCRAARRVRARDQGGQGPLPADRRRGQQGQGEPWSPAPDRRGQQDGQREQGPGGRDGHGQGRPGQGGRLQRGQQGRRQRRLVDHDHHRRQRALAP